MLQKEEKERKKRSWSERMKKWLKVPEDVFPLFSFSTQMQNCVTTQQETREEEEKGEKEIHFAGPFFLSRFSHSQKRHS